MPSQETHSMVIRDFYTTAPLTIWKILSFVRLQPLQSMVINHFIGSSLNVILGPGKKKPITARKWVEMHTTDFARDRGCSNQAVNEALKTLVEIGLLEVKEAFIETNSGVQKGRMYCLVSNTKLDQLCEDFSKSATPLGSKHYLLPENVNNSQGSKHRLSPRQAPLVTSTGPTCHLDRPYLLPYGVFPNEVKKPKYSLKNLKYFLKMFGEFQNSFLELYYLNANSKTVEFKIKAELAALIRQYGPFSVWIACTVNLFDKDAQIGDLKLLRAFIETNIDKIKNQEENFITHSDNLYLKIFEIHQIVANDETIELENFRKIFRQKTSFLFSKMGLEQSSSEIFLYSSFTDDVIRNFDTCVFTKDRFTDENIKKLNLYFKAKILGMKGLNVVQSLDH